ncbi:MAG: hypothetical protein LBU39_06900 [Desulfobulbaceae bacterium]|jgi:hypothetical protein|nr:hypothetical protein [Desulfobulbaceae bacterium]
MEKQVIFRDRQELQSADLNSAEDYIELSLQHFVSDAITPERLYTGFIITSPSATEIAVSPGHLWDGVSGNVYVKESEQRESVVGYLPVTDSRWLTLSVKGDSQEIDIQPRDFLIDLQSMQTEPRMVAMVEAKVAALHIVSGLESSSPQKENPPTGYTLIGFVRLTPSGVVEIVQNDALRLFSLFACWQETRRNRDWIDGADPLIASLKSDLAALAARVALLSPNSALLTEITRDVANLKDLQNLPDTFSIYGSDWILDEGESDILDVDYHARAEEGIRFPWANITETQPGLDNPYADEVKNHDGMLLPAYNQEIRLSLTTGYAGNLPIGSYQYATHQMIQGERSVTRIQYGPTRDVCTNSAQWAWLKGAVVGSEVEGFSWLGGDGKTYKVTGQWYEHGGYYIYRIQEFWRTTVKEKYLYEVTNTQTIAGSMVAQTFLAHQSGWLCGIDLYFDAKTAEGDIWMAICETELGQPDTSRSLSNVMVAAQNVKIRPTPTPFTLAQPVFLEAGRLYAIVLLTQGGHKIALTEGTNYTQGTLFTSTDGAYHQGDLTKDFMMRLRFARFLNPRTVVELQSLNLDGGIADLDFSAISVEPANTELAFEFRKEGDSAWYPMQAGGGGSLVGKPPLVHLRAVFKGDEYVMPSFDLPGSTFRAARPAASFRHISTARTLPSPTTTVTVTLRLENWNADKHTCEVKLRQAEGTGLTVAATTSEQDVPGAPLPTVMKKWSFALAQAVTAYRIQVEGGSTNELDAFHVAYRHDVAL